MLQRLTSEVMNIHFGPRTTVSEVNIRKEDRWRERMKVKRRTGREELQSRKNALLHGPLPWASLRKR